MECLLRKNTGTGFDFGLGGGKWCRLRVSYFQVIKKMQMCLLLKGLVLMACDSHQKGLHLLILLFSGYSVTLIIGLCLL